MMHVLYHKVGLCKSAERRTWRCLVVELLRPRMEVWQFGFCHEAYAGLKCIVPFGAVLFELLR